MIDETPAVAEAKNMLSLLRAGESVESVRKTIGNDSPYRRHVLLCFDLYAARLSKNRERVCKIVRLRAVSDHLRSTIIGLLNAGESRAEVERMVGISRKTMLKLRHQKPDFKRCPGRKKLSAKKVMEATQALREGQSWARVAERMSVTVRTLATNVSYRKRDDRKQLSSAEASQAIEQLKSGITWAAVAAQLGMRRSTLQAKLPFLKSGPHHRKEIAA